LHDLKDISTGVHSTRLAEWAIRVARKLNIPQGHMYQVEVAALLHDIGKVDVPDSTLKKQGPLKPEKHALINRHPEYSHPVLRLLDLGRIDARDIQNVHLLCCFVAFRLQLRDYVQVSLSGEDCNIPFDIRRAARRAVHFACIKEIMCITCDG
jgi:HD domain